MTFWGIDLFHWFCLGQSAFLRPIFSFGELSVIIDFMVTVLICFGGSAEFLASVTTLYPNTVSDSSKLLPPFCLRSERISTNPCCTELFNILHNSPEGKERVCRGPKILIFIVPYTLLFFFSKPSLYLSYRWLFKTIFWPLSRHILSI